MNKKIVGSALLTTLAIFAFVGCGKKKTTKRTTNNLTTIIKSNTTNNKSTTTKAKTTTQKKIEVVDGDYLYANEQYLAHALVEDKKLVSIKLFSSFTNFYIITPTIVDGKFEKITMTLPLDEELTEKYMVINKGTEFTPFEKVQYNIGGNRLINLNTIRVSDDKIEIKSMNKTTTIYLNGELNDSTRITGEVDYNGAKVTYNNNVISATYNYYDMYTSNFTITIDKNKVVANSNDSTIYTTEINGTNVISKTDMVMSSTTATTRYYQIKLDDNGYISTCEELNSGNTRMLTFTYSNDYQDLTVHYDNPGDDNDFDSIMKFDNFRREIKDDGYTTTYDKFGNITKYACSDYECVYAFNEDNTPKSRLNYYPNEGNTGFYLSYSELYKFDNLGRFIEYKTIANDENDRVVTDATATYDNDGNLLSLVDMSYDNSGRLNSWSSKSVYTYSDGKPKTSQNYSVYNYKFYLAQETEYAYEGDDQFAFITYYNTDGTINKIEKCAGLETLYTELFEYTDGKLSNYKYVEYIDSSSIFVLSNIDYCIDANYNASGAATSVKMYVNDYNNSNHKVYVIDAEKLNDKDSWKDVSNYTYKETVSGLYSLNNYFVLK